MDKTPEYIKMCEMAELEHEMQVGDYYIHKAHNDVGLITNRYDEFTGKVTDEDTFQFRNLTRKCNSYDLIPSHIVWLPRQDQLQDMMEGMLPEVFFFTMSQFSHEENNIHNSPYVNRAISYIKERTTEKLTLMYVMWKNHNKVWNGEDWIES